MVAVAVVVRMLTVNQLSSSLPRSHAHFRRSLPAHLSSQPTRRRSLSHPAPSDPQDGKRPAAALRSHVEEEDEEDEDEEEEEDEMAVQAEGRDRLAAFVLKETSGESSDEDELGDEDEDSSSSASSSGSTPQLKPVDPAVANSCKRAVTFHSYVSQFPAPSLLPPPATAPVVHRKLVKPSSRQHKASPHHYSSHQSGSKTHAIRLHRRKPHTVESTVILLPDDTQARVHSLPVDEQSECVAAADSHAIVAAPVEASLDKPAPLIPRSSVSRYALLVAILRRSDGRDKLIRIAYFGTNHGRALVHAIHNQLSHNKRLLSMLSIPPSSSTSTVLPRLLAVAASFCQSADVHLGRLHEVLGAARQLLRFGRWVYDLQSLSEAWQEWKKCASNVDDKDSGERRIEKATAMLELINAFLSVIIDLMDDVEWLAEHRVLPSALSSPAGLASAVLWLTSVCIDIPFTLHALSAIPHSQSRAGERRAEQLSLLRYAGDLLYSGSLVAEHMGWSGESDAVRWRVGDSGGLLSAVVSLYKLSRSETLHRSVH